MLNQNELEQYRRDGYVVIDGLFSPQEVEELRLAGDDSIVKPSG